MNFTPMLRLDSIKPTGRPIRFSEMATWQPICSINRDPQYLQGYGLPDTREDVVITLRLTGPRGLLGIPFVPVKIGIQTPSGTTCQKLVTDATGRVDCKIPASQTDGHSYKYAFLAAEATIAGKTVHVGDSPKNLIPYYLRNPSLAGWDSLY